MYTTPCLLEHAIKNSFNVNYRLDAKHVFFFSFRSSTCNIILKNLRTHIYIYIYIYIHAEYGTMAPLWWHTPWLMIIQLNSIRVINSLLLQTSDIIQCKIASFLCIDFYNLLWWYYVDFTSLPDAFFTYWGLNKMAFHRQLMSDELTLRIWLQF